MSQVHMIVGIAVLATNAATGITGAVCWVRGWHLQWFWWLLRAAQVAVVVQVALGLLLVARGSSAPDGLHIVYGISPLIISFVSEGMRVGVAQRELEDVADVEALTRDEQIGIARKVAMGEMGVMTVGVLMILTLALRAYQTGGG